MSDEIAFSICIPNYNYADYIGETIQSVLDQTYLQYEIVVVDNKSTDNSVEVVKSFDSECIRLIENPYNVGFGPNLDRAVMQARNPYVILLSSDDLMRPTALEEYARVIKRMGSDAKRMLLVSSVEIIDGQGNITGRRDRPSYYSIDPDHDLMAHFSDPCIEAFAGLEVFKEVYPRMSVPGHFCTTMYSRQLYEQIGGYSSIHPIGPDAHLAYKALLQDAVVIFIGRPLFAYRMHGSNQLGISQQTLKVPINSYLFSIQYSREELANAGVTANEMASYLVNDTCLRGGLAELRNNSRYQAFRFLAFAFASYPHLAFVNWKAYGLGALLFCGPLGPILARLFYRFYVRKRKQ